MPQSEIVFQSSAMRTFGVINPEWKQLLSGTLRSILAAIYPAQPDLRWHPGNQHRTCGYCFGPAMKRCLLYQAIRTDVDDK
jgi:hypothetical protein